MYLISGPGTTQTTAWTIKTKLAEVMRIDNDRTPLKYGRPFEPDVNPQWDH